MAASVCPAMARSWALPRSSDSPSKSVRIIPALQASPVSSVRRTAQPRMHQTHLLVACVRGQLEVRQRKKLSNHREVRALLGVALSRHGGLARTDLPTCNLQASAHGQIAMLRCLCSNLEFFRKLAIFHSQNPKIFSVAGGCPPRTPQAS